MAPLLVWGLPDSQRDDLLFDGGPAWSADRYGAATDLERLRERNAGADTDLNPLADRNHIVDLTPDDAARAEILRRYRLFSRQPDEMIIFRALQRMNPRQLDLDPKLYQYGGGYVYMVGAALGVAALPGFVHVTGDAGTYLEHPESFARFYLVARFISLVFGALTLVAVGKLARRAGGGLAGWIAMFCVALSPVFITGVLEAKPHLPSACLLLWAVLSALDYHASGRRRDALRMGLQAGYAFGMVLTGIVGVLLWPVLLLARPAPRRAAFAHLAAAAGLAIAVYVVTNPYIPYNWLFNRAALASNIGNSTAMYQDQIRHAAAGAARVVTLLVESGGVGVPIAGMIGLVLLLGRYRRQTAIAAAAGLGMLVVCVLLGVGKPAEYARFLILPVLLLAVAAAWLLAALVRRHALIGILATVVVLGAMHTPAYVRSFIVDASGRDESRGEAGRWLAERMEPGDEVGLLQEPAPYAVPPLDFVRRRVLLLPADRPAELDQAQLPEWLVFTADDDAAHAGAWWQAYYHLAVRVPSKQVPPSPIAWANKPVFVYRHTP